MFAITYSIGDSLRHYQVIAGDDGRRLPIKINCQSPFPSIGKINPRQGRQDVNADRVDPDLVKHVWLREITCVDTSERSAELRQRLHKLVRVPKRRLYPDIKIFREVRFRVNHYRVASDDQIPHARGVQASQQIFVVGADLHECLL